MDSRRSIATRLARLTAKWHGNSDPVTKLRQLFLACSALAATIYLLHGVITSNGGIGARVLLVVCLGWHIAQLTHVYRRGRVTIAGFVTQAIAIALVGAIELPASSSTMSLGVLLIPALFFLGQYGDRRTAFLGCATLFAGYCGAYLFAGNFSPAVVAQLPPSLAITYVMHITASTVGRNSLTATRQRQLTAISPVLMAVTAQDELQSVAIMAAEDIAVGLDDVSCALYERDESGEWVVVASVGTDAAPLRLFRFSDNEHPQPREEDLARVAATSKSVHMATIVTNGPVAILVWTSTDVFDDDFTTAADGLAALLAESARRLDAETSVRLLLAHSVDALVVMNDSYQVEYASPAIERLTGRTPEQVMGRSLTSLVHRQHVTELARHLHSGTTEPTLFNIRWGHTVKDLWKQTETTISMLPSRDNVRRWVVNVHDVSEQISLELQLRHSQKLEAVGRLAAGVAHEINTPIQFIGNNLSFVGSSFLEYAEQLRSYREVAMKYAPDDVQAELTAQSEAADLAFLEEEIPLAVTQAAMGSERVAQIVRAMKTFGHLDSTSTQLLDINAALDSTLTVATSEIKPVADVVLEFGDLPPVAAYAADLNQAFLNLVVNACHAMGDVVRDTGNRGVLTVKTWQEKGSVTVAISDTGGGIPANVQEHVFEPFFTTKEVGSGTGQGLALAHAVVTDKHGGEIWFETAEGTGTTFFIKLNIDDGDSEKGATRVEALA